MLGHLDMKHGRVVKDGRASTVDVIWDRLDDFQKAVLENGFGKRFSADFYPSQRGLTDPTGEIEQLVATILKRL